MKTITDLIAAFTTNPHVQGLKNVVDRNGDGKIDAKDLEAEVAKVKADLESRKASYYHVGIGLVIAFAGGVFVAHHYL